MGLERAEDHVGIGFEDDRRLTQSSMSRLVRRTKLGFFSFGEKLVAVLVDGVLRVFEGMAGEDQDCAFFRCDFAKRN